MAFIFDKKINPEKPLDINDLPPSEWKSIDTHDYRKALFGFRTDDFQACCDWEQRELARVEATDNEKSRFSQTVAHFTTA